MGALTEGYRCLSCGHVHPPEHGDPGDCGRCGMSTVVPPGWTPPAEPTVAAPGTASSSAASFDLRSSTDPAHCPHPDCGQPLLPGDETCAFCGRPARATPIPSDPVALAADGTEVRLPEGREVVLGRSPDHSPWSRLFTGHAGVSRRHTSLTVVGDQLHVRDLGSANGTWVNGVLIDGAARVGLDHDVLVGLGLHYHLTIRSSR